MIGGSPAASLSYVVRRALQAVAHAPFAAATVTLTVALALMGEGALLAAGDLGRRGLDLWGRDLRVSVFVEVGCSPANSAAIADRLAHLVGVPPRFVSREVALHEMRASFGELGQVLDDLPENPLRDAFEIPAGALGGDRAFSQLARELGHLPCVADVDDGARWLLSAQRLVASLRLAGAGLFALISLVTLVLVSNTFQLAIHGRRDEIGILKLVGGTDGFVRWPFLLEGLLQGVLGGALAALALALGFLWLWPRALAAAPPLASLGAQPFHLWRAALALSGFGGLLGMLGSGLAVGRFLGP